MPEYEIHPITDCHYELADSLPDGKVCDIVESPGRSVTRFLRGYATQDLMDYASETVAFILTAPETRWVQVWVPGAPRLDLPPQGLGIAHARWELLTPETEHLVPAGEIALPIEREGSFIWLIRPPHIRQEAIDGFNLLLDRLVGDGLWRQRWNPDTGE